MARNDSKKACELLKTNKTCQQKTLVIEVTSGHFIKEITIVTSRSSQTRNKEHADLSDPPK